LNRPSSLSGARGWRKAASRAQILGPQDDPGTRRRRPGGGRRCVLGGVGYARRSGSAAGAVVDASAADMAAAQARDGDVVLHVGAAGDRAGAGALWPARARGSSRACRASR
jgi:hypothetical protein